MFRGSGDSSCTARGTSMGSTTLGDSGGCARGHRCSHAARLPRFLRTGRVCCPLEHRPGGVRSSVGSRTRYPPDASPDRSSLPGIRDTFTHDRSQRIGITPRPRCMDHVHHHCAIHFTSYPLLFNLSGSASQLTKQDQRTMWRKQRRDEVIEPDTGFRRGEGGWVDAGWAFMVARSPSLDGLLWPAGASPLKAGDHQEHRISHFFRRNILLVSPLLISST